MRQIEGENDERPGDPSRSSVVRELRPGHRPLAPTDAELVGELRSGTQLAAVTVFDRHGKHVERLLFSLLGPERDAEDLLHEVFLRAIQGIRELDEPAKLRSWLTGITVFTAREHIRKRVRRRWLSFVAEVPEPLPVPPHTANDEVTEATRCTFEVLRGMSSEDRV
ncbi:MAG TPA: RNA polymerase sigma factor, partial [Labilithrix sp.]|nr:RNA polymerase sigma factor [Labilithrix sp.]